MRLMSSRVKTLLGLVSVSLKRSSACWPRLAEYTTIWPLGGSGGFKPRPMPTLRPRDFSGLSRQASTSTRAKAALAAPRFSIRSLSA